MAPGSRRGETRQEVLLDVKREVLVAKTGPAAGISRALKAMPT